MPIYKNENRLDSEESIAMNIRLLDLMKKTSYRILQVNGQRRYGGPPPEWSGPPPPKDSEVFVGKIPRNCFEDELVPVFSRVGKIYELRLMMDFSGTNRGYAFVMYTSPREAERAVNELNNFEIRPGRNIGVVRSTNNCKIYIGTLSGNVDRKTIKKTIKCLTEGVVDVKVHVVPGARKRTNSTRKPHFIIAEYESHRAAAMARRRLLPARLELWGHEVSVEWANTIQKLTSSGQISNLKASGNRRRSIRNEYQMAKELSDLAPDDAKLINGRTLEQAMDEMLYGSSENSLNSTLCGTESNSTLTSDSDVSFTCPNGLDLLIENELSEKPAFYYGSDDSFSEISCEEISQFNVNVGLIAESYLLNGDSFNSDLKQCSKSSIISLPDSFLGKFSEMSVGTQYQLFDYGNGKHNVDDGDKSVIIQNGSILSAENLENSGCQVCPVINWIPGQQFLSTSIGSEVGPLSSYPLFQLTNNSNEIQIENV